MFHKYPYTDFHESNMDWFLNKFTDLLSEWSKMQSDFKDLQEAVDSLKEYVRTYFDNLDVQEEINNKIDEMVESGEFINMINLFNSHIRDTYGTYETATVDNVRNNNEPVTVNGRSDAAMAGYGFWDSVGRYTGYKVIPETAGKRFTASDATLTSCKYVFPEEFTPLIDRFIFLFSVSEPTDLNDCYYGRITSVDRLDGKFYVEKWYKHGDTSGTGYLPDTTTYKYGIYNLKTHAYGDVCDINVGSNGDPVLGTVSGRQTNLHLDKDMLNNVTMDECVVRSYDSNRNVIGYSVRDTTDGAPVTAFYGGVGVNTIIGSYYVGPIIDRYGANYTNYVFEEDGTTNFSRHIVLSYGENIQLRPLTGVPRDRHFYLVNNSGDAITLTVAAGCTLRLYGANYTNIRVEAWACVPMYYDYTTSNYNVLVGNVTKSVGVGNWSSLVRVNGNLTLNPANFIPNEYKILINYTSADHTVTVTGFDTYTVPAGGHKILYYRDGTNFDFV